MNKPLRIGLIATALLIAAPIALCSEDQEVRPSPRIADQMRENPPEFSDDIYVVERARAFKKEGLPITTLWEDSGFRLALGISPRRYAGLFVVKKIGSSR